MKLNDQSMNYILNHKNALENNCLVFSIKLKMPKKYNFNTYFYKQVT